MSFRFGSERGPRRARLLHLFLLLFLSFAAASSLQGSHGRPTNPETAETATTTVFLVRHAEKVRGEQAGKDPDLTDAGRARARALAHTLGNAGVDVVYSTQLKRNRQTAAPLADLLGLETRIVQTAGDDLIERMKERVLRHRGQTVVFVGHSNTTPQLARALGAVDAPDIADDEFEDLYQLIITGDQVQLVHLRYGHPTP